MRWVTWGGAFALVLIVVASVVIAKDVRGLRYVEVRDVPARPVAIVFGADVTRDDRPSRMLAGRLDGGLALYRAGKVRSLVLTGDDGRNKRDELDAMLNYTLAHGVRRDRIELVRGYTTYDSCRRSAREGIRSAVLVTQSFHLPRALFLCRSVGMDAVGLATSDWGVYGKMTMLASEIREALARVKAVGQIVVLGEIWSNHPSSPQTTRP